MKKAITQNALTQAAITPAVAIQMLKDGNERFLNNAPLNRDFNAQIEETSRGQFPFAVILSCIDSRIPTEIIFDQGIGDIFNVRIAGNFVNEDILGSMEFACEVAGSCLVLVMGHTQCGAIKGACDKVELGNLTGMIEKILPSVDATPSKKTEERTSANTDFVNRVSETNVHMTIQNILEGSAVLRKLYDKGSIEIAGAMYDVKTGEVSFYDDSLN